MGCCFLLVGIPPSLFDIFRARFFGSRRPPLRSCDVRLPAEPLEVRLTFCGNSDSEIALVLVLDVQGQLGGRREVVLRDAGQKVRG